MFKVMEHPRGENNDFALASDGTFCIAVFVERLRKRNTFYF